jgi:hypothetical protein
MAKFNLKSVRAAVTSAVRTAERPSGRTFEGAPGFERDAKGELFLLGVANLVGEDTFYEGKSDRDGRFRDLVASVAVDDPEWLGRFLRWLRAEANLRSAPVVGALEASRAMVDAGLPGSRALVAGVLRRADEPAEALAYWLGRYGRNVPKPVKRGLADAVVRLYDERNLLKYDSAGDAVRFGDVIDLVHPVASTPAQGDLFRHALDRRHGRGNPIPESLPMLRKRAELAALPVEERQALTDPEALRAAGMTWEATAGWRQGELDAAAWTALIPTMGYMALLRNLRNFDKAGVSDEVAATVAARLSDPAEVARSKQLPMRFLSAYRAARSLRWAYALETALQHALSNVPELAGRTLVLVDTSGSMNSTFSRDGALRCWDAATVFGLALAGRCAAADVVAFSTATMVFGPRKGESLLRAVERWKSDGYFMGQGTDTAGAVREHYNGHDRVVILTDEQAHYHGQGDVTATLPATVPAYTWNLVGYRFGHAPSGSWHRHTFGGLTDAAFRMIPLIEAGRNGEWPF